MKQNFTTIIMLLLVSLGIAQNDTTEIYIHAKAQITNETLPLAYNGSIDVTVLDGAAPFQFNWNNGATTEDITGLSKGEYALTVSDSEQKTGTFTFYVQIETVPNDTIPNDTTNTDSCFGFYATTNATHLTASGSNDGAIDLTVFGGQTPYTYNWDTGEITEDLSSLSEGYYKVIIEDANGCKTQQSDYIYYYNNSDTNIWANPIDTFVIEEAIDTCFELTINNVVIEEYKVIEDSISITWNVYDINANLIASFNINYEGKIDEAGVYNFNIVFVKCTENQKAMNFGASYSGQLYIDPTVATSIRRINTISSEFNVFPNPVKNILTIEGQTSSTIEIMDINGKVVKIINNASEGITVDISALTKGIYFVKTGNQVQKLVKL